MAGWGIRGVALDLDNTIVPWHTSTLVPGALGWVRSVQQTGIRMCLLTNNYGAQAKLVAQSLGLPLVRGALKPMPWAFARSLQELEVDAAGALAVGDQLFTDVLGAKLAGMRAVVVRPVDRRREFPTTRFLRLLERPVFARLRRTGLIGA